MFKAVVSDLDGTLLNAEHKVSDFTRETVELLLKKGIKFYIATGRNYLGAKEAMDELGVKVPLITSHGSVAFDENGNEQTNARITGFLEASAFLNWLNQH